MPLDLFSRLSSHAEGLLRRWRVRTRRLELDAEIAANGDSRRTPELELRMSQLSSPKTRSALAAALLRTVNEAEAGRPDARLSVRLHRPAVLRARSAMVTLADALTDDRAGNVRGVAQASLLVWDDEGPLHRPFGVSLEDAAKAATAALWSDA
jgi:hypothetical protein